METYSWVSTYVDKYLDLEFHEWWVTIISHGAMSRHGAVIVLLKKKSILTLVKRVRNTLFRLLL